MFNFKKKEDNLSDSEIYYKVYRRDLNTAFKYAKLMMPNTADIICARSCYYPNRRYKR